MEAFHITSSRRELVWKQRYFHFGSSLLELKIYQALRRFRGIAYIPFGMDCAASPNTAPSYDCRYTCGLSRSLENMGSEMSISRPAPLRNALHERVGVEVLVLSMQHCKVFGPVIGLASVYAKC